MPTRTAVVPAIALLSLASGLALAGPINPPPGPVTSTNKTLAEVEPRTAINAVNTPGDADSVFRITQPGSYYLTGNLSGVSGKSGIEIAASGVTIDLGGFMLTGVSGAPNAVVVSGAGLHDIAIFNGVASAWDLSAIDTFSATHCRVEAFRGSTNGGAAVRVGAQSLVRGCTATLNASAGISTQASCVVEDCVSGANVGQGISAQANCVVARCSVEGAGSNIGIDASNGSTITACSATGFGTGIQVAGDCTVTACTSRSNTSFGVFTGLGCTVSGCTIGNNGGDGIRVNSGCTISGNSLRANGATAVGAGVHATGADNRIEGNNCTSADIGIDVDAAGNFIARNTCSGNTTNNWDVVAGNVCLVVNAATAPAITGTAGGTAPGSTDPNANFTY